MAHDPVADDSSHYEVSLTAGQAFVAFLLLLGSLGAAFAFGILVGRGQLDERLLAEREPAVISEEAAGADGTIVELGVESPAGFSEPARTSTPPAQAEIFEERKPEPARAPVIDTAPQAATGTSAIAGPPVIAQVLSSSDMKAAEALAAKLIDGGFASAYVERVQNEGGMIYRVRVRFGSEAEARAAADRLKALGGSEVWIIRG
ncbi:MAG TPA: SPOR domain-containing protein [Thermoanaerobaculia bacterium]|nr:SPOR domain-containing protein [Thermoanaerobaculia bacterium]